MILANNYHPSPRPANFSPDILGSGHALPDRPTQEKSVAHLYRSTRPTDGYEQTALRLLYFLLFSKVLRSQPYLNLSSCCRFRRSGNRKPKESLARKVLRKTTAREMTTASMASTTVKFAIRRLSWHSFATTRVTDLRCVDFVPNGTDFRVMNKPWRESGVSVAGKLPLYNFRPSF